MAASSAVAQQSPAFRGFGSEQPVSSSLVDSATPAAVSCPRISGAVETRAGARAPQLKARSVGTIRLRLRLAVLDCIVEKRCHFDGGFAREFALPAAEFSLLFAESALLLP